MHDTEHAPLDGVFDAFGALPDGTLITENGLASLLNRCGKSIKRAVRRGELPPPVKLLGKPTWTVGVIRQFLHDRLAKAADDDQAERERIAQY